MTYIYIYIYMTYEYMYIVFMRRWCASSSRSTPASRTTRVGAEFYTPETTILDHNTRHHNTTHQKPNY